MSRESILQLLGTHADRLKDQFGLKQLALFGSAARDELSANSDIDILVEFAGQPTFDGYMDLKFLLEDLLQTNVDLVTKHAIKPRMWPIIEKDLVNAT